MTVFFCMFEKTAQEIRPAKTINIKAHTMDAIKALSELMPEVVTVIRDGEERVIGFEALQKGDTVLIRAGEGISVDGTVIKGNASIDKSALTGESIPEEAYVGDDVGKSDGEAFRLSGRRLDDMKEARLSFLSSSDFVNEELAIEGAFVDDIVSHWSRNQAFVAYQYFQAEVPTQQAIARKLRVTAQRINQIYHTAKIPLVLPFLVRFENIVTSLLA